MIMAIELRKALDKYIEEFGDILVVIPNEDDYSTLLDIEVEEWTFPMGSDKMHILKLMNT